MTLTALRNRSGQLTAFVPAVPSAWPQVELAAPAGSNVVTFRSAKPGPDAQGEALAREAEARVKQVMEQG